MNLNVITSDSKMSVIVIPLIDTPINNNSINTIPNNTANINKNQTIKITIHDVMTIQSSLNNIKTKFDEPSQLKLTGDLGYLLSKEYTFNKNKIILVTPVRKNQKKILTEKERKNLKTRYKIENGFDLLKQNERLMVRKDRNIKNFMSPKKFIYKFLELHKILQNFIGSHLYLCHVQLKTIKF
jgi:hypothetical protein